MLLISPLHDLLPIFSPLMMPPCAFFFLRCRAFLHFRFRRYRFADFRAAFDIAADYAEAAVFR